MSLIIPSIDESSVHDSTEEEVTEYKYSVTLPQYTFLYSEYLCDFSSLQLNFLLTASELVTSIWCVRGELLIIVVWCDHTRRRSETRQRLWHYLTNSSAFKKQRGSGSGSGTCWECLILSGGKVDPCVYMSARLERRTYVTAVWWICPQNTLDFFIIKLWLYSKNNIKILLAQLRLHSLHSVMEN